MNMPAGLRRVATVAALAAMLGGCSTVTGWFTGSDNAPKPTPLQTIQNNVTRKCVGTFRWAVLDCALYPGLDGRWLMAARDGQVVGWTSTLAGKGSVDTRLPLSGGIGAKNGALYVATTEGETGVARRKNGKIRWRSRPVKAGSPASDGQRVLVRTNDGRLSAFDADSGKVAVDQRPQPTLTVYYTSTTLVGGETVLLGTLGGRLAVIGANNMGDLGCGSGFGLHPARLSWSAWPMAGQPPGVRPWPGVRWLSRASDLFDAAAARRMWSRDVGSSQG